MKTLKYFTLAACALLGLAACSSDDAVNEGASQIKDGNGYVSFNIVTNGGTRADNNVFEDGTGNENDVQNVLCVFYNRDGSYATKSEPTLKFNAQSSSNPAVEKIAGATVVLSGKAINARKVLVVLNYDQDTKTALIEKSLSQALDVVDNYADAAGANPFLMTNSSYIETVPNNLEVCATEFTDANVKKEESDAIENPVDIYVERVLAKVELDLTDVTINSTKLEDVTTAVGTSDVTVYPVITNYQTLKPGTVVATAGTSYLFKDIESSGWTFKTAWPGWNDFNNRRSYWANIPGSVVINGYVGFPTSYDDPYDDNFVPTPVDPNNKNFGANTLYVQENTSSDAQNQSKVIVFAQLKDANGNPVDLISCNGANYSQDAYITLVANMIKNANVRYRTSDGGTDAFSPLDFELERAGVQGNKAYNCKVKLTEEAAARQLATGTDANSKAYGTKADMDAVIDGHVGMYWQYGKCYYYVTIEHQRISSDNVLNGVVRNHVYKVKVNSISGLGTPVFDPDPQNPEPIIPEKPDEVTWNLAAKINVLKWRVVSQNVDLK